MSKYLVHKLLQLGKICTSKRIQRYDFLEALSQFTINRVKLYGHFKIQRVFNVHCCPPCNTFHTDP